MIKLLRSLRAFSGFLVLAAFLSGVAATWLMMDTNAKWRVYQADTYAAGLTLYAALQNGTSPPNAVRLNTLSADDQKQANSGAYLQLANAPSTARITNVPIIADAANPVTGAPLALVILSPDLTYPLANLPRRDGQTAAETTASVIKLLASYCSDPMVIGKMGDQAWMQIDGAAVWGCDAAPSDRRIFAGLLAIVALAILMTLALNLSADFTTFAAQLRNRRRVGGPAQYSTTGPQELQEIVAAVNSYLETERSQLESRAAVLSGVSHDLGTPATRLRLRAALIEDTELRQKLVADIDSMTGIIESVLTYTRAEMSAEAPRKLSLTALIDAIVADYQDIGRTVTLSRAKDQVLDGAHSVFMSRHGKSVLLGDREITIMARPIALQRAVTNLIDNALKYGRRATVSLETNAESATIIIEDEGGHSAAKDIENLLAPFQRGDNTKTIEGYGLGLTIVATIANLHGGALTFDDGKAGLTARLTILRN